ncbi:MAG: hypothetical protein MZV64_17740 [Ignavibacteriales bacterium]|nr:hypothetical protein [Ignavibacteriales bacterium]
MVITGLVGVGQIVAGFRHHLRRRSAPLRRDRSRRMRASSSGRWTSPMWITSRASRPPSRSTRSPPATTRARRSAP